MTHPSASPSPGMPAACSSDTLAFAESTNRSAEALRFGLLEGSRKTLRSLSSSSYRNPTVHKTSSRCVALVRICQVVAYLLHPLTVGFDVGQTISTLLVRSSFSSAPSAQQLATRSRSSSPDILHPNQSGHILKWPSSLSGSRFGVLPVPYTVGTRRWRIGHARALRAHELSLSVSRGFRAAGRPRNPRRSQFSLGCWSR